MGRAGTLGGAGGGGEEWEAAFRVGLPAVSDSRSRREEDASMSLSVYICCVLTVRMGMMVSDLLANVGRVPAC